VGPINDVLERRVSENRSNLGKKKKKEQGDCRNDLERFLAELSAGEAEEDKTRKSGSHRPTTTRDVARKRKSGRQKERERERPSGALNGRRASRFIVQRETLRLTVSSVVPEALAISPYT